MTTLKRSSSGYCIGLTTIVLIIACELVGRFSANQENQHCERGSQDCTQGFKMEDPHGYLNEDFKCKFPEIEECKEMEYFYDHDPKYRRYEHVTYMKPKTLGIPINIDLVPGKKHQKTAVAQTPPVYEIPDFLTDEECDYIIEKAKKKGMEQSGLFGADINEELETESADKVTRISEQTWFYSHEEDKVVQSIMDRVKKLTRMPQKYIDDSEAMQVVRYGVGGHYHAHLDTTRSELDDDLALLEQNELPCCHQTRCTIDNDLDSCCKACRYITVLFYLNDVEEGGETAFPFVDLGYEHLQNRMRDETDYLNLSKHCHDSMLVVRPQKGKAVMWYNHEKDHNSGILGLSMDNAYHGGCDVKKGTKWIANVWISVPPYDQSDKLSVYNMKNWQHN